MRLLVWGGRVKTVTLRVGARAKEGKRPPTPLFLTRPISSPLFNMRFREKNIRAPEEKACTAGYLIYDTPDKQMHSQQC